MIPFLHMIIFAIVFIVLELALALGIFLAGLHMMKIPSFKKALDNYEKKPSSHTFIQDWFLMWRFEFERKNHRTMIKHLGDKGTTRFFNASGLVLLLGSVLFVATLVIQFKAITF